MDDRMNFPQRHSGAKFSSTIFVLTGVFSLQFYKLNRQLLPVPFFGLKLKFGLHLAIVAISLLVCPSSFLRFHISLTGSRGQDPLLQE